MTKKNQINMRPPKETNTVLKTDPREMEIYVLSEKEFRILLLRQFSELPEHTDD